MKYTLYYLFLLNYLTADVKKTSYVPNNSNSMFDFLPLNFKGDMSFKSERVPDNRSYIVPSATIEYIYNTAKNDIIIKIFPPGFFYSENNASDSYFLKKKNDYTSSPYISSFTGSLWDKINFSCLLENLIGLDMTSSRSLLPNLTNKDIKFEDLSIKLNRMLNNNKLNIYFLRHNKKITYMGGMVFFPFYFNLMQKSFINVLSLWLHNTWKYKNLNISLTGLMDNKEENSMEIMIFLSINILERLKITFKNNLNKKNLDMVFLFIIFKKWKNIENFSVMLNTTSKNPQQDFIDTFYNLYTLINRFHFGFKLVYNITNIYNLELLFILPKIFTQNTGVLKYYSFNPFVNDVFSPINNNVFSPLEKTVNVLKFTVKITGESKKTKPVIAKNETNLLLY
ncbi:hypothetical protein AB836_00305 [Rickettsiales bacterium (ex Bugula neritina AB1)]|nr:hypothetical protein AB836_00305 [Rickettsiales bacterium (ex Bugula neritina AB1)]